MGGADQVLGAEPLCNLHGLYHPAFRSFDLSVQMTLHTSVSWVARGDPPLHGRARSR